MGAIAAAAAALRQFGRKYVATIMGGLQTSISSTQLFLTLIYDVLFLGDGSYENQNIQGYFLCISIATILSHVLGVVVFGLPSKDESDYIAFPDTEDTRVTNENDDISYTAAERNAAAEERITTRAQDESDKTSPNYSPIQMLKSPRYTPVVLASGLLLSLKYISLNNLNVMLASFRLSQYEASLPFVVPASGVILRPIFGVFADWTRPYFSRIWYLYLAAGVHLLCFLVSIYKADNVYVMSVFLILWPFAADTASTIQPAVIADDFGSRVSSVNIGILLGIFAVLAYAIQSAVGVLYETRVPEGSNNCFGLICFQETFGMGIGFSLLSMWLITLYVYMQHKSTK